MGFLGRFRSAGTQRAAQPFASALPTLRFHVLRETYPFTADDGKRIWPMLIVPTGVLELVVDDEDED